MTATATMLDAALDYARRGMPIFPAHTPTADGTCSCRKPQCDDIGKHPRTLNGLTGATTDPTAIGKWWDMWPLANIAVRTGAPSGTVVLDVDPHKGGTDTLADLQARHGTLPDTIRSITGGMGEHIFFRHPGGHIPNSVGKLGPGIDIRGDGGYIIAAPSLHRSGRRYEWEASSHLDDVPLAPAPTWLLALLRSNTNKAGAAPAQDGGDTIPEGRRNATLFKTGCAMRRHGASQAAILAALLADNAERCNPPLPNEDVHKIARSAAGYPPTPDAPSFSCSPNGQHEPTADEAAQRELPALDAGDRNLPNISAQAWAALVAANDPAFLFRYGGLPVRLDPDLRGGKTVIALTEHRLRHELARCGRWFNESKSGGLADAMPPVDVVRDMLAAAAPPLPVLDAITVAPTFAPDGSLLVTEGYHPAGRAYYAPAPGFAVPSVPGHPTHQDIAHARTLLCEDLLGDFPFVGRDELAHAVAVMVLPFARALIDGPTPLHLIEKPSPGTGATLLADTLMYPAIGRNLAALTEGRDEEEWRKRLTAVLRTSPAAVFIDNLKERLDTAALAAILTTGEHEDRILGTSDAIRMPVRAVWLASGNNPTLSNEITRRTVRIRLDAHQERPWLRRGFRHPNLHEWVREERPRLCHAVLTLVRAWLAEGKPRLADAPLLGMYEDWSRVIGGILAVAEIPGFLGNLNDAYAHADAESDDTRILIEAWWATERNRAVTAAEIFPVVIQHSIPLDLGNGGDRAQRTKFGQALARLRDRRYTLDSGTTVVVMAGRKRHGAQLWELAEVKTS